MAPAEFVHVSTLPPSAQLQYNMLQVHTFLKLGYTTILAHLDNPPRGDLPNFLGYCEAWAYVIAVHHDTEEEVIFPFLNEKLDFAHESAQHAVIHTALDALGADLRSAQADATKFDPDALKASMAALREPLFAHLDDEVADLAPEKLAVFSDAALLKMYADLEHYSSQHGDPYVMVPFVMAHTPPELKPTWPPFPWFVRWLLGPYLFSRRYAGRWKYAPYATS